MNKKYTLNTLLALILGAALLVCLLIRVFLPRMILPQFTAGNLVLLSLVTLVLDHYLAKDAERCYICIPLFAFLAFTVLPFAACFVGILDALKTGLLGAVVFTATTWLFSSMVDRISTGPAAKAAPIISALGLYLAAQGLLGIL